MKIQRLLTAIVVAVLLTLGIITLVRYVPIPGLNKLNQLLQRAEPTDLRTTTTGTDMKMTGTGTEMSQTSTSVKKKIDLVQVTEISSPAEITALTKSKKPMVIKFYTSWCPACIQAKTIFPSIAQHFVGKVDFYSINLENHEVVQEAEKEGINKDPIEAIPTFVFLQNGKVHDQTRGFPGQEKFENMIKEKFGL